MAWNRQDFGKGTVPVGGRVATSFAYVGGSFGSGYKVNWNLEKAHSKAFENVTWVYRCVTAIASNQARLPIIFRENNSFTGAVVEGPYEDKADYLSRVLNRQANYLENALTFRHRVMAQLLLSKRGVFIEKVYDNFGRLRSLHLLPPELTSPIPDPKKVLSGFKIELIDRSGQKTGKTQTLDPEKVLWIRNPNPLDPYSSTTPIEAAGLAIDIEGIAKVYNRNFMHNDGRGSGLLVFRNAPGNEDDLRELQTDFSGDVGKSGVLKAIEAADGVEFIDFSASPRDAAYVQQRALMKEEILSAFGVPESVIGNASNRTFSNAAQEGEVFWHETMMPYLEIMARAFDELHDEYYVDFDVSNVPVLILARQERNKFSLTEYNNGLISVNEYRESTGRSRIQSDFADSIMGMTGKMIIGSTTGPLSTEGEGDESADVANIDGVGVDAGTDVLQQSQQAMQERVVEYDPQSGSYSPSGSVQGVVDIEKTADEVGAAAPVQ